MDHVGELALEGYRGDNSNIGFGNKGILTISDPNNILDLHIGSLNYINLSITVDSDYIYALSNRICKFKLGKGEQKSGKVRISIGNGNNLRDVTAYAGFTVGNGTSLLHSVIEVPRDFRSYSVYGRDLGTPFRSLARPGETDQLDNLAWWDWNERKLEQLASELNGESAERLILAATPPKKAEFSM